VPRRRLALAGAGVAAGSAAIAVVTLAGGGASDAWAVDAQPDGSVTVQINSLRDASGLESNLRRAGIPAVVRYSADCAPATAAAPKDGAMLVRSEHHDTGPGLQQAGAPASAHGDIARAKLTSSVRVDGDGVTFTLDPGRLDPGDHVFITTSTGQADAIGIAIGRTPPPPGCPAPPSAG
jgi:hypothetical protein